MPPSNPDPALYDAPEPRRRRVTPRVSRLLVLLTASGLLAACGKDEGPITDVRERSATRPRAPETTTRQRFQEDPHGGGDEAVPRRSVAWEFETPEGWEALPPAPMREAGFRVAGKAECTLSTAGGSLKDNVNRWRGQMGLEPVDDAAIAALPREPFLGRDGALIELEGTYGGMRGGAAQAGWKMLGLAAVLPATSVFVKMVGPAAVVDAEKERFRAFARSVRPAASTGHGEAAASKPSAAPSAGPLRWIAPAGWIESAERPMRVVTLVPQGTSGTECYVSVLGGAAGGTVANVNRWRDQMGLEPAGKAEIDALPRLPALGAQGVLVVLEGSLDDPMRGVKEKDALLYGLVVERATDSVFVKMTGPASEMRPQRDAFEAFCRSLEASR